MSLIADCNCRTLNGPMASSGSLVMAGASRYRLGSQYYAGAVFVFVVSSTSVTYKQRVMKPSASRYEYFGNAIATVMTHKAEFKMPQS